MKTNFLEKVMHIIFTTKCIFCGELLECGENICQKCRSDIDKIDIKRCSMCNKEFCECNKKYSFSYVISVYYYDDKPKEAIKDMKFRGYGYNAKGFSEMIYEQLKSFKYFDEVDMVVEVPMHFLKRLKRGYNQTELIAKYLCQRLNKPFTKRIVKKIKNTKEQSKLDYKRRVMNLNNAYRIIDNSLIKNKVILLIDDVLTTGSTANECSKVLINNGAKKVYVATCCKTKKEKV